MTVEELHELTTKACVVAPGATVEVNLTRDDIQWDEGGEAVLGLSTVVLRSGSAWLVTKESGDV